MLVLLKPVRAQGIGTCTVSLQDVPVPTAFTLLLLKPVRAQGIGTCTVSLQDVPVPVDILILLLLYSTRLTYYMYM